MPILLAHIEGCIETVLPLGRGSALAALAEVGLRAALGRRRVQILFVQAVDGILEPEVDRAEVLKLPEGALHAPGGGVSVPHAVAEVIRQRELDHVQHSVGVSCEDTRAGGSVLALLAALRAFGMVVAEDDAAASFGADPVELVGEVCHVGLSGGRFS